VADAVRKINEENTNSLGVIFRRCPVDFSSRYDKVLKRNKDLIVSIDPIWKKIGEEWNTVLPTKDDVSLLTNTIYHTDMVVNLGSSMVFDYICFKKPCAFINYDVSNKIDKNWSVSKIYNYIHFRSMQDKKSVIWLNSANEIVDKIKSGLEQNDEIVQNAQKWFEIINQYSPEKASNRIWKEIEKIVK